MIYHNFIVESLSEASEIAMDGYGRVESSIKAEGNMQVLTEIDLKIGQMLIQKIKNNYPDHNIIDEEAGVIENGSSYTWTIDPIDGTANYAAKIPMFGVMLGLLKDGMPIAGGIVLPFFNEMYYAEKGFGASCNEKKISVSHNPDLGRNFLAFLIHSYPEDPDTLGRECEMLNKLLPNIMSLRTSNCTSFDGVFVACGKYGIALNENSLIWDCVPLHILVEEAGGMFTDFRGEEVDYTNPTLKSKQFFSICCGAKVLHEQTQELLAGL